VKLLIVGLGSMGKRRIRNLQHLKAGEIFGFDPRADRREESAARYGVKTCESFDEGMAWRPDAVIISTPPDQHLPYALSVARAGVHFFTELNVVDDGLDALIALTEGSPLVAAPSCTFRFHPSVKRLERLVAERTVGPILYFSYHSGQYLPDWHPYEDYRSYYVAQRHMGAGREMVPFELNWLTWVFGRVTAVSCLKGKVSGLDVDIDDLYQCLLTFDSGVNGMLLVDVVARVATRLMRCYGEDGVIIWDHDIRSVRAWSSPERAWTEYPEPDPINEPGYLVAEDAYIDEMRHFIRAIHGEEQYRYSFAEDREILNVLRAAEQSSHEGVVVRP